MGTNEILLVAVAAAFFAASGFLYARGGKLVPEGRTRLDLTARLLGIAGFILMVWVGIHAFADAMTFEPSVH
ncbi:MAG: hypothetical protein JO001_27225 [Alphaproteobacteria bacterium]|nr:hypothetical protein [Alphaproteobacteria bacterium]